MLKIKTLNEIPDLCQNILRDYIRIMRGVISCVCFCVCLLYKFSIMNKEVVALEGKEKQKQDMNHLPYVFPAA